MKGTDDLRLAIAAIAGYAIVRRWLIPDSSHNAVNAMALAGLGGGAAALGLTTTELGLAHSTARTGWRDGVRAFGLIAGVIAVAAAVPATRGYFDDERANVGAAEMLRETLVVIPIATVFLEEFAFRGLLLGLARRRRTCRGAVVMTSALFGLWHVPPLIGHGVLDILGTVGATTAAGLAFAALRIHSGSLLAPVMAHLATNSVAFAAAWMVTR